MHPSVVVVENALEGVDGGPLNVRAGGRCFAWSLLDSLAVEVVSLALVFGRVNCLYSAFRNDPLFFWLLLFPPPLLLPNICGLLSKKERKWKAE